MSAKEKKTILKQIDTLKDFPNTKTVRQLRKELQEKLRTIESKVEREKQVRLPVPRAEIQRQANLTRASKLKKYHNYLRQIRNNYPNVKYTNLRKMFKLRKAGKEVSIPDVIWQNPSS